MKYSYKPCKQKIAFFVIVVIALYLYVLSDVEVKNKFSEAITLQEISLYSFILVAMLFMTVKYIYIFVFFKEIEINDSYISFPVSIIASKIITIPISDLKGYKKISVPPGVVLWSKNGNYIILTNYLQKSEQRAFITDLNRVTKEIS